MIENDISKVLGVEWNELTTTTHHSKRLVTKILHTIGVLHIQDFLVCILFATNSK